MAVWLRAVAARTPCHGQLRFLVEEDLALLHRDVVGGQFRAGLDGAGDGRVAGQGRDGALVAGLAAGFAVKGRDGGDEIAGLAGGQALHGLALGGMSALTRLWAVSVS